MPPPDRVPSTQRSDPVHDGDHGGDSADPNRPGEFDGLRPPTTMNGGFEDPNLTLPDPDATIAGQPNTSHDADSTTGADTGWDRTVVLPRGQHAYAPGANGRDIGTDRYSLTRMHAQGGIGQVWVARDHHLSRDVALKRLKPDISADPATRARFLREARVTGQLQHPGVVPLYELAEGPGEGELFYTMQFINGRTMTEAARDYSRLRQSGHPHRLELRELLNAFLGVCQVVAYAHSRGVIHRDLKGQNIVLGDYGEVMVLDWGMAKVENLPEPEPRPPSANEGADLSRVTDSDDFPSEHTIPGVVMGTPGFMPPEQAQGNLELVGPRSDVYGLGAILYEILIAEPPFWGPKNEVLRKVVAEDPVRPRHRLPEIPGALDAICMTCLARDPAARYSSAGDLAKDVQRYLGGEPVSTYQEPWSIRLRRWAGQHRSLVTATGATTLVATVCLAVAAVFLHLANLRETVAHNEAVANFKLALDTVERFFTKVGDDQRLKAVGLEKLRRDLLVEAKNFYETLARDDRHNGWVGGERGQSYLRLAKITEDLGEYGPAVELSRKAQSIFEELLVLKPSSPEYLEGLARALETRGSSCQESNRVKEAETALKESVATWKRLIRDVPNNPDYRYRVSVTLTRLGHFLGTSLHEVRESEMVLVESLEHCDRLVREHPESDKYGDAQAEALAQLGYSLASRDFDSARIKLDRALELQEDLAARHPESLEQQAKLVNTCLFVATAYCNARKPERVREVNRNVQRISERLAREHPDVPIFVEKQALIEELSAINTAVCGDHVAAIAAVEKALAKVASSGRALTYAACGYAVASESASRDATLLAPDRSALVEQYQARAMELLRTAEATGLFTLPYFIKGIQTDPDLASLRPRKDFQQFLETLETRAPR